MFVFVFEALRRGRRKKRKQEVVLRLLKGEPIELLSRELSVPAATLSEWRETFLKSALNGLLFSRSAHLISPLFRAS